MATSPSYLKIGLVVMLLVTGSLRAGAQNVITLSTDAQTSILSAYGDNNFGDSPLRSGTNGVGQPSRAIFSFDFSSIPAGATITSVQMSMTVTRVPPGDQHAEPADSDFQLYRMLVPWTQGSGAGNPGSPANPGETTWNERGAYGVAAWGQPGGQSGTDYANSYSASTSVGDTTGTYSWGSMPQFVADVQDMMNNPSTNYGWMMISDGESTWGTARQWASPTLTVTYTDVPEPCAGLLLVVGAMCLSRRSSRR